MTYYFVLFSACGFTDDIYPDQVFRFTASEFNFFATDVQYGEKVIKNDNGECYSIQKGLNFETWNSSIHPNYTIVTEANFTSHVSCVACDPTYDSNGNQIIHLTPCNVALGMPDYYYEVAFNNIVLPDIKAGHTAHRCVNGVNASVLPNTVVCYTITIENSYGDELDTADPDIIYIDTPKNNCAFCENDIIDGGGQYTYYYIAPCVVGQGTAFFTDNSVSAWEISPGVYKTLKIAGNCYSITGTQSTEGAPIVNIPTVDSSWSNCADCKGQEIQLEDCDNPGVYIYSEWTSAWYTQIVDNPSQKVKVQGAGELCFTPTVVSSSNNTGILYQNGNGYADCTACTTATAQIYELTNCDNAAVIYTQLDLSLVDGTGDIIKRIDDDSCWTVVSVAPAAQSIVPYLITDFYHQVINTNGVLIPTILKFGTVCQTCLDYEGTYKFVNCDGVTADRLTDNYPQGLTYFQKTVKLDGIDGCWTMESYTPVGGENYETFNVLNGFDDCDSCNTVACYTLLNLCTNTLFLADNGEFGGMIGTEILVDTTGDGFYDTRARIEHKTVGTNNECDGATNYPWILVNAGVEEVHEFRNCRYNVSVTSKSDFSILVPGQVLSLYKENGELLKLSDLGIDVEEIGVPDSVCWTYIGVESNSGCTRVLSIGTSFSNCTTCVSALDPEIDTPTDGVLCESPCYPVPVKQTCNTYQWNEPCIGDSNYYVDFKRLGLEDEDDEFIIENELVQFYDMPGLVNTSRTTVTILTTLSAVGVTFDFKADFGSTEIVDFSGSYTSSSATIFHEDLIDAINALQYSTLFKAYAVSVVETKDTSGNVIGHSVQMVIEHTAGGINGQAVTLTTKSTPANFLLINNVLIGDSDNVQNVNLDGAVDPLEQLTTAYTFTAPTDGIYIFTIRNQSNDIEYEYVLFFTCDLLTCYDLLLKLIFCNCDCADCGYDDTHDLLNAISTVYNTYLSQIAAYSSLEIGNGGLSNAQFELLTKIKDNYSKLNDLLSDCNGDCLESKLSDCGCR